MGRTFFFSMFSVLLLVQAGAAQAGTVQLYSEDFEHATSSDLADVGWTAVLNAGSGAGLFDAAGSGSSNAAWVWHSANVPAGCKCLIHASEYTVDIANYPHIEFEWDMRMNYNGTTPAVSVVVEVGGNWYVSKTAFLSSSRPQWDTFTLSYNPAKENWDTLDVNDAGRGTGATSDLSGNITGFGLYSNTAPVGGLDCTAEYDSFVIKTLSADFNVDGVVNFPDFVGLASAWLTGFGEADFNGIYDLHNNDTIDGVDLGIFAQYWLRAPVHITVDAGNVLGEVSPMLMGFNMSYYHDTDVLWADGNIANYLSEIDTGILRYPGGGETSYFHWEYPGAHGYHDVWEPDANNWWYADPCQAQDYQGYMNTDEFIGWCQVIGAEPLLGVNIESGVRHNRVQDSVDEAVRWVQHCLDNGYGVKYWYLDNEPYNEAGNYQMTVDEYITYIPTFSQAMKAVDPNIKIVVNWRPNPSHWEWTKLIQQAGEHFDFADVHCYYDWGQAGWDTWVNQNPMLDKNQWREGPTFTEEVKQFNQNAAALGHEDIKMVVLEWNIGPNEEEYLSPFQYALMHSEMFAQYIEGGLHMAGVWPLIWNVSGDNFRSILNQQTYEPTPVFDMFKMYSNILGRHLVQSSTAAAHVRPLAAVSEDGNTAWLYLLHKSGQGVTFNANIQLAGFEPNDVQGVSLTADNLGADEGVLTDVSVESGSGAGRWRCTLPPHSLTMITFSKN